MFAWIFTLLLLALHTVSVSASDGIVFVLPVFLNATPAYLRTGTAGLAAIASDAAREATEADVAILGADCFTGSLVAGDVTQGMLDKAISRGQDLVVSECSPGELVQLFNDSLVFGSATFPHVSGIEVHARRVLDEEGNYRGQVSTITQGNQPIATLRDTDGGSLEYDLADVTLRVVTVSDDREESEELSTAGEPVGTDLQTAFSEYVQRLPDESISYYADQRRVIIVSDTVDADLAVEQLTERIPSPVYVDLFRPTLIPDAIFYMLSGQQRDLAVHVWDAPIPYSLSVSGLLVATPQSMDCAVDISQEVPAARKTANTFDENTIFVDLRQNDTIPDGSVLTMDVSSLYDSETFLHVYYYEQNGDITPLDTVLVDASGSVHFPVDSGATYILNAQQLDHSTLFEAPTRSHPFTLGIMIILVLFVVWVVVFVSGKRREKRES